MTFYILPIVEGQTEQKFLERLLHRVWRELLCRPERLQIVEPFRGHRDALVHPNGQVLGDSLQKALLKLKARTRKEPEAQSLLLILLDAEGDCPATLAPRLLALSKKTLPADTSVACVLARRMLENWIVGGASTLARVNGLPSPLPARDYFEERSGAAWLEGQLRSQNKARKYKKTADAEPFVRTMNLQECRGSCPSFDKLCRDLEGRLPQQPDATTAGQAVPLVTDQEPAQ